MNLYVLDKDTRKLFASFYDDSYITEQGDNIISLGVLEGDKPLGLLVAAVYNAEIDIQFIFVDREYRRQHIASTLLKKIISVARSTGAAVIYSSFAQDTEGFRELLKSFGFTVMFNPGLYSYEDKLGNLRNIDGVKNSNLKLKSFYAIDKDTLSEFNERLRNEDILVGVPLPIDPRNYSPFSCCSIVDGKISDLLLVTTKENGDLTSIDFPWIYSNKASIHSLSAVYNTSVTALKNTFSPDSGISFCTINPEMDSLLTDLIPTARYKEIYMATLEL